MNKLWGTTLEERVYRLDGGKSRGKVRKEWKETQKVEGRCLPHSGLSSCVLGGVTD